MKFSKLFQVKYGKKVRFSHYDPSFTAGFKKDQVEKILVKDIASIVDLEYRLYAEGERSLLIVLQAMDSAGKDGVIRHVMSGFNPQSCKVTAFKVPSAEEAAHDFLWRVHKAIPSKGEIGIFNRSHYEEVLVVRVHSLQPKKVWSRRYDEINAFEEFLAKNGVTILKFFLHISKDEQKKRLQARLDDTKKNWKLDPHDLKERKYWTDYMLAYEEVLSRCSTKRAPWFIIPANRKWFRNLAISRIIIEHLQAMEIKTPKPKFDLSNIVVK